MKEPRLASPRDRLAATVADFVFFLPVAAIAVAPLRKQALIAQLLNKQNEWEVVIVWTMVVFYLAFVVYQTLFLSWLGRTPGKMLLGLAVVSVWSGEKPKPMAAFLRSAVYGLEALALGLPWLAVFANEMRRPAHDRFADTAVVVTDPSRQVVGPPVRAELAVVGGVYGSVLTFTALMATILVLRLHDEVRINQIQDVELENQGRLCAKVGEVSKKWVGTLSVGSDMPSRVEMALALYGAESIDKSCLEKEADHALWKNKDKLLGYLAKGIALLSAEKRADLYLSKVCHLDPESVPCSLVHLLRDSLTTDRKSTELAAFDDSEDLTETLTASSPVYYRVWVIRHLIKERRHREALVLLQDLSPHPGVGIYYLTQRARILWSLGSYDESRWVAHSAVEAIELGQRVSLMRWLCSAETMEFGCAPTSRHACSMLDRSIKKSSHWLARPEIAVTHIRGELCREDLSKKDLMKLAKLVPGKQARSYLKALLLLHEGHNEQASSLLKKSLAQSKTRGPVFFEICAKVVELAKSVNELEEVKGRWLGSDKDEGWSYVGRRLIQRFSEMKAWDQTLDVGMRFIDKDHHDQQVYRAIVVAAFHKGKIDLARGFLGQLDAQWRQVSRRLPAAVDDFAEVINDLRLQGSKSEEAAP